MTDTTEELVARARQGLIEHPRRWSGDTHNDLGGSVDYEATDALSANWPRIEQWSRAYPTKVFPKPDLARAAKVLSDAGMSLDVISADNMRHATEGVGKIARAALKGDDT